MRDYNGELIDITLRTNNNANYVKWLARTTCSVFITISYIWYTFTCLCMYV